jgi:Fe2+ or Zn2+ uptake regulation protein
VSGPREAIHDAVRRRLGQHRLIYTSGRRSLVEILLQIGRPVTVPEIRRRRTGLTQSSVYRNLVGLERVGVVRLVTMDREHACFEIHEDFIGHHHHLICVRCGSIADFRVPKAGERALDRMLSRAARSTRFRITDHRLDAVGVCAACR